MSLPRRARAAAPVRLVQDREPATDLLARAIVELEARIAALELQLAERDLYPREDPHRG